MEEDNIRSYKLNWIKRLSENRKKARAKRLEEKRKQTIINDIEKNGVHFPSDVILNHSGFGGGVEAWTKYHIGKMNVAQYMSPKRLTGNSALRDSPHFNLCGELATIASLGLDLEEGMRIFSSLSGGKKILNNNMTTSGYHLGNFIAVAGEKDFHDIKVLYNSTALKDFDVFEKALSYGDIIIALVNIDTSRHGNLRSVGESSRKVAHWVWIQTVFNIDDLRFVRLYNSYMNREEVYLWETFLRSYERTYGNSSMFLSVNAKPKIA